MKMPGDPFELPPDKKEKLQRAKRVRLLPTVGQAERLGDEFGIH